ncbi:MAG: class I SAM-dependent rRNA methyltransferase [Ignavibacteriales bacterium]|nr:class I SAM-dependent rRNA methyltransferase [Ignavibacteriales bacterium]MBK7267498.1 class I SAM-dependent rRNA methyltransferase [Ignavibacteriales bacterium]MBK8664153.1 class I SAM-dependent rRNA methyltransferase [Ignavibacteriales bacterium]MBP9122271.1 class I SAM-dependent rRNA methyltransferase [Ignavibacteriaceae bacterium]MCC6636574.1 class I SAM-dependent rRNA methyltransferase [Ignavibacteriaceae bacterium]
MANVKLRRIEERRLKTGHQWIFSNEIQEVEGNPENGSLVNIYYSNGQYLGTGFYNKHSLFAIRILDKRPIPDLRTMFVERIFAALGLREKVYPNRKSYRMVFSESDFLPGLIIDKYNDTYVLQVNTVGMEKNLDIIVDILHRNLGAENVFTRNSPYFRQLEGLEFTDEIFIGNDDVQKIDDGKVKYRVNFQDGQKTGFYFDQCDNRNFTGELAEGLTVLDAFCNSGGFGLHCAYNNAESVDFVDSSVVEIQHAEVNFNHNVFACEANFIVAEVFEYLKNCADEGKRYDMIIIDPPAFAKQKKNIIPAKQGYQKLNRSALRLINNGGYLITSSCSFHITKEEFLDIIKEAAYKEEKVLQLIRYSGASLDHPIIPSMPETSYLKFCAFRVFDLKQEDPS